MEKVREYILSGNTIVVSIDIKDYFDNISHNILFEKVKQIIDDKVILDLIHKYLKCLIQTDDDISEKKRGIVQGNPISPILSNIYLMDLDSWFDEKQYEWIRFADNIFLFFKEESIARDSYAEVCGKLSSSTWELSVNYGKSGVFRDITSVRILGYEFKKTKDTIEIRKASYIKKHFYPGWHPCVVSKVNREYHIVKGGVLNKKDYALLFENEEQKYHIPVEVTDQLNLYSDVTITPGVIKLLSGNRIRMVFADKYGNLIGHFVPSEYSQSAITTVNQCALYLDEKRRFETARAFEIAGIHNMRSNIRYYNKKNHKLGELVDELTEYIKEINEASSINQMMLIEARAKQKYYHAFNVIINVKDFTFVQRTKRPPRDEINALISFGNVVLYNLFLQFIWKSSLDPRIGVVHSTTRRNASLNLDFADVFKPIITDRIIFSLINCHRIISERDFVKEKDGVFLSDSGKRIYLEALEDKLNQELMMGSRNISYRRLMEGEVYKFQKAVTDGGKYKPYKYY